MNKQRVMKGFDKFTERGMAKLKGPPRPQPGVKAPNQMNYSQRLDTGNSLVLSISYGGTRSWRIRYTGDDGKPRTASLEAIYQPPPPGPAHPKHLGVADAIRKALAWKPEVVEPDEVIALVEPDDTVRKVAERWLTEAVEGGGMRTAKTMRRQIERFVIAEWGTRSIGELRRSDVDRLLGKVQATAAASKNAKVGGRTMADKLFSLLSSMMNWWAGRADDFVPPIVKDLRRDKRTRTKSRDRVLDRPDYKAKDWREIKALWAVTSVPTPFHGLVRMLLLTGQRIGQVRRMKYADIVDGVWTLPVEDAEREKQHVGAVRLPALALQVIDAMGRKVEGNDYVFPAVGGRGPVNASSFERARLAKALQAMLPGMPPFVLHDLRRTMRTILTDELHVPSDIAEAVLGHSRGIVGTTIARSTSSGSRRRSPSWPS